MPQQVILICKRKFLKNKTIYIGSHEEVHILRADLLYISIQYLRYIISIFDNQEETLLIDNCQNREIKENIDNKYGKINSDRILNYLHRNDFIISNAHKRQPDKLIKVLEYIHKNIDINKPLVNDKIFHKYPCIPTIEYNYMDEHLIFLREQLDLYNIPGLINFIYMSDYVGSHTYIEVENIIHWMKKIMCFDTNGFLRKYYRGHNYNISTHNNSRNRVNMRNKHNKWYKENRINSLNNYDMFYLSDILNYSVKNKKDIIYGYCE